MVDGVLLLVDAAEGPLPQTRFVLRKALEARLPVILVVNKVDRSDARVDEVVHEVEELFLDLDADEHQISFPIVYCNARTGRASLDPSDPDLVLPGTAGDDGLKPLLESLLDHIPPPQYDEDHPLQALVTNLDASPYVGRLALCRVRHGVLRRGEPVAWCRADGTIETVRITELYVTEALDRVDATEAGAGEIVAIAGLADVTIGETLADPDDPRPLPVIHVDEPSLAMTVGINTSPLSGREGNKLTARLVKGRLDAELVGNVSLRVAATESPDAWEVQGRGELQLAVLVEMMRREGFELTVGKPQVVVRHVGRRFTSRSNGSHRHPRGAPRRRDPAPRHPKRPAGADDQPRHRLGPHGVPRRGPGPGRLPYRVPDPDPRHGPPHHVFERTSRGSASSAPERPGASSLIAAARPPRTRS